MTALHRKLWRDLWLIRGQALAISLVLAAGVAMFVMALSTLRSLEASQTAYYDRYRFADVFAHLKRAPRSLTERVAGLPGVARVQARVVEDVLLDVPGMSEPAVGRLISLPEFGRPVLNDVHLRRGRWVDPGRAGEVLVSEAFARAHGLEAGDSVVAILNGRRQRLRFVGVALSPEYVVQVQGGNQLPDDRRFGVFWMSERVLGPAFDMKGAFNDLSLKLTAGAVEEDVIARVDDLIRPYGGQGAYGRSEHLPHRYLSDEIRGLRGTGLVAPLIFLAVAAFLLNVVLSRLVSLQREQIATLKAFGYGRLAVGLHYGNLALAMVLAGALLGVGAGAWLGRGLTEMYAQFYRFPIFDYRFDTGVCAGGVLLSMGTALLGALGGVRRAMRLSPAEAMRPEPPARYRPTLLERAGLERLFSSSARMILRNLERRPLRALLSSLGIALGVAVLVVGRVSEDMLKAVMEFQFQTVQRESLSLSLVEPSSGGAIDELARLPGVLRAEPYRAVPARLRAGPRSRRVGILGLEPDSQLRQLRLEDGHPFEMPPSGVVLSEKLAKLLGVGEGDEVGVEVLEGRRPVREMLVSGLIWEVSGLSCYMSRGELNRLMEEGPTLSGAFLAVDGLRLKELYRRLKKTPKVASATITEAALASFEETVGASIRQMQAFTVIFAMIIACGVVYNSARISLSERTRDLATLRVLGFRRAEISFILLGELAVLTLVALPLGMVLGYGLSAWAVAAAETEMFQFPVVIDRSTFAFAAVVVLAASMVSGLMVRRKLDHLDLLSVLKSGD